jgi:phage terminase large subunit-like protein
MWDLSCVDWEDRLREGRSLIPDLPLIESEATVGLQIFDELQLPDVPGKPRLGEAAGDWFRDIVRAAFGSWDPESRIRYIRDILALAPKGSSKTSYSAGLMLSAMLMNKRPRAEALFVGPTQAISDRAYEQSVGMIEESKDLQRRFRPRDHIKTIEDLLNGSEMKVKTFDLSILTGSIPFLVLLDELHLLGRSAHTAKVLRQIRGGLDKTQEGLLLITTTQSDDEPTGAFRSELKMARDIRDGKFKGQTIRPMLPILYEFPRDIAKDPKKWQDPANWPMVMPNLGRSVHMNTLVPDWETERQKGESAIRIWASQHLNIEIGIGLRSDNWAGAEFWEARGLDWVTFEALLERCDVITFGVDGGGADDLLGLYAIGREKETRRWLGWGHAFAHPKAIERRKENESKYEDLQEAGDLTVITEYPEDLEGVIGYVERVFEAGLLGGVGLDQIGIGGIVEALAGIGVTEEEDLLVGVSQGYRLAGAIKTIERKLIDGSFVHGGQAVMAWCVGNAKVEPTRNAFIITKQASGMAKIDPLMAMFDAAALMERNPEPNGGASVYDEDDNAEPGDDEEIDMAILADPRHPRFQEMRERYEARLEMAGDDL